MKLSHNANTEDLEKIEKLIEKKNYAVSLFNNADDE